MKNHPKSSGLPPFFTTCFGGVDPADSNGKRETLAPMRFNIGERMGEVCQLKTSLAMKDFRDHTEMISNIFQEKGGSFKIEDLLASSK